MRTRKSCQKWKGIILRHTDTPSYSSPSEWLLTPLQTCICLKIGSELKAWADPPKCLRSSACRSSPRRRWQPARITTQGATTPVSYESWEDPPSSDMPHSHDQSATLVPPGVFLSTTHTFAPCAIFLFTLKQLTKKTPWNLKAPPGWKRIPTK